MSYLPLPESILKWVKVTRTFEDFATAALTNTIDIMTPLDNTTIHAVIAMPSTAFNGGSIASYTLTAGYASSPSLFLIGSSIFTIPGSPEVSNFSPLYVLQSSGNITLTATSVGDNLDQATQGVLDVWLLLGQLP